MNEAGGTPPFEDRRVIDDGVIEQFRRDGHVVVRGLADPGEVSPLAERLAPYIEAARARLAPLEQRTTYDKAFLQMFNLWRRDPVFEAFTLGRRFADVAAQLLGAPAVRLYHDQALVKEGLGGRTPWHQDQRYWPLTDSLTATMWMALVDCTPEMGTMQFASGSQRFGDCGPLPISDESEAALGSLIEREGWGVSEPVPMRAGDASFHSGWVIHGAPGNATATARQAMTVIYVEDGARVTRPDSPERQFDLAVWLPGLAPGDVVDSPLNPRLG